MLIKNECSSVLLSYSCTFIREEEPGDTLGKHGAETERRTRRCSFRSVEPASQKEQSVLWEMMSTSGKSLLVIIHYTYLTHSPVKIKVPTVRETSLWMQNNEKQISKIYFAHVQNYFARNFYNMRLLALFVAFAINFILLFYKVSAVSSELRAVD